MTVKLEDRPIEQVREETIDQLIYNYSHGVISAQAFERRLEDAMASKCHQEIVDLIKDLTLKTDSQYRQQKDSQLNINYAHQSDQACLTLRSVLSNNERSGRWLVPKEINLTNILGTVKLDFTDAVFQNQDVTIHVNCILGSDEIYIPEGVNVVCETFCIMGSIENKAPSIANRQAPTIHIKGKLWLGSIDIQVKRTMKEKFLSFATEFKTMLNGSK